MQIILATANEHKAAEFRRMASAYPIEILTSHDIAFDDDIEENGKSFRENALIKASALHKYSPENIVFADDSGLCVDALDGAPGIYSSRLGSRGDKLPDDKRNDYLLNLLKDVPDADRTAQFRCCIVLIIPPSEIRYFEGKVEGKILLHATGHNGFGYDPIFQPQDYDVSMAELRDEEKDKISHRGKALRACLDYLQERYQ